MNITIKLEREDMESAVRMWVGCQMNMNGLVFDDIELDRYGAGATVKLKNGKPTIVAAPAPDVVEEIPIPYFHQDETNF